MSSIVIPESLFIPKNKIACKIKETRKNNMYFILFMLEHLLYLFNHDIMNSTSKINQRPKNYHLYLVQLVPLTNLGAPDLFYQVVSIWLSIFRFSVLYNGKEGYSSTFIKLAIHAFYLLHLTIHKHLQSSIWNLIPQ